MLKDFITQHRSEILERSRTRVAERSAPKPTDEELAKGIPLFLDLLVQAANTPPDVAFAGDAAKHGADMLRMGFTIAQVVRDYGDVCQSITDLAVELNAPISTEEFRSLNLRLDDAIAEAVTEYQRLRERSREADETERLGSLAHELRNKINAAMLAYSILQEGRVGLTGSTGAVLHRNLRGIQDLITRSLAAVRVDTGIQSRERIDVRELLEEVEVEALMSASASGRQFSVGTVKAGIAVDGDRPLLAGAIANLLDNAFKFTREGGLVTLRVLATNDRVTFEVEDECGGLASSNPKDLFTPWTQRSTDKSGLGLGLPLVKRSVEASGGDVSVQNVPGRGCIFRIGMPRAPATNGTAKPSEGAALTSV